MVATGRLFRAQRFIAKELFVPSPLTSKNEVLRRRWLEYHSVYATGAFGRTPGITLSTKSSSKKKRKISQRGLGGAIAVSAAVAQASECVGGIPARSNERIRCVRAACFLRCEPGVCLPLGAHSHLQGLLPAPRSAQRLDGSLVAASQRLSGVVRSIRGVRVPGGHLSPGGYARPLEA